MPYEILTGEQEYQLPAQKGLKLNTSWGEIARSLISAVGLVVDEVASGTILAQGVHVGTLGTPVSAGVGRTGEVGGQKTVVARASLDKPEETGTKHGGGCDDKFSTEGLDGRERSLEFVAESIGHGGAGRGDTLEEEVVVVRHGGIVEDGGLVGLSSCHESNGLCVLILELGAWTGVFQSIQLLHHEVHVLGPGERETSRAHKVGNTLGIIVWQLGNMMDRTAGIDHGSHAKAKGQTRNP
ncbi:unnamed protein product [Fusarium venenatum]|uniref:Uncharacterized protein n=1 Tax=Fusarium venenatum TaxID=56646 RepID=A0A2L2T5H9_9HYPO|nr:uncharacterized protein FVRRES_11839 [Fusarium venenatum]CEI39148.1 unnamed protein product [Fusarium venenatum]